MDKAVFHPAGCPVRAEAKRRVAGLGWPSRSEIAAAAPYGGHEADLPFLEPCGC